jgi:hypothetical protein
LMVTFAFIPDNGVTNGVTWSGGREGDRRREAVAPARDALVARLVVAWATDEIRVRVPWIDWPR